VIDSLKMRETDRAAHRLPLELGLRNAAAVYAWRALGATLNAGALAVVLLLVCICYTFWHREHLFYAVLIGCVGAILAATGAIITGTWISESKIPREVRIALWGFAVFLLLISAPVTLFILDKAIP